MGVSFKLDTIVDALPQGHSMSRYRHLAFQTLKAACLGINTSEARWHMVSARTVVASQISVPFRLRQDRYVDVPAARALEVYGPLIARDHE